jgi:5-formyltetrahydrofolate cyclo-ligase
MQSKIELRQLIKQRLKCMSVDDVLRESELIWRRIETLPEFIWAQNILVYWSMPSEVNSHAFVEKWAGIKDVYLPVIDNENLRLVRFLHRNQLSMNPYFKILEPTGDELLDLSLIDIVFVPGMAFDSNGNRMGKGGGFYDRLLPNVKNAIKIGVAFQCQLADGIPLEPHDVPMQKVIWGV